MTSDRWPRLVGGHPALDFVNTDVFFHGHAGSDIVRSSDELQAWFAHVGVAPRAPSPHRADAALLRDAKTLRAALRSAVEALTRAAPADPAALETLRAEYASAIARATPELDRGGLRWSRPDTSPRATLDGLLRDAIDLLRTEPLGRIKACPRCGFVFRDATKNASRRWCSMEDCGTREKVRRYVTKRAATKSGARVAE